MLADKDAESIQTAESLMERALFADAVVFLRDRITKTPRDEEQVALLSLYAEACVHTEDFAQALDIYATLLDQSPCDPEVMNNYGYTHMLSGNLDDAIGLFQKAHALDSQDAGILANLSLAYQKTGQLDEALQAILAATQLYPDSAVVWNNQGVILRRMGRDQDAEDAFSRALQYAPYDASAINNLGCLYRSRGDVEKSASLFRRIVSIDDPGAAALRNAAVVFTEVGDHECARHCCDQLLSLYPDTVFAQDAARILSGCGKEQT